MFSTAVMRSMKQKEQNNTGKQTRILKAVKKAKEDWIGTQCEEIKTCLNKNNIKRAYQLVKNLTPEKQGRPQLSRTGLGNVLLKILSRWIEYCSELYNHESCGDNAVLDCSHPPEEALKPILHKEIEISSSVTEKGEVCWS